MVFFSKNKKKPIFEFIYQPTNEFQTTPDELVNKIINTSGYHIKNDVQFISKRLYHFVNAPLRDVTNSQIDYGVISKNDQPSSFSFNIEHDYTPIHFRVDDEDEKIDVYAFQTDSLKDRKQSLEISKTKPEIKYKSFLTTKSFLFNTEINFDYALKPKRRGNSNNNHFDTEGILFLIESDGEAIKLLRIFRYYQKYEEFMMYDILKDLIFLKQILDKSINKSKIKF